MDVTFTGRGLSVDDALRELAIHKVARLERIEPRATRLDLTFINEHYPTLDGLKRVEAAMKVPRKSFFAHAEAKELASALDHVVDKLERQLRDHHGKRHTRLHRGLESAHLRSGTADTSE
jgi:ribosomal subunit interface protein